MRIYLGNNFYLNSDQFCVWITQEIKAQKSKTGKESVYERTYNGYHADLPHCMESFLRKAVNSSEAETVIELCEEIKRIDMVVKEFCKKLKVDLRKLEKERAEK